METYFKTYNIPHWLNRFLRLCKISVIFIGFKLKLSLSLKLI